MRKNDKIPVTPIQKEIRTCELSYKIYEVSQDGLLKEPKGLYYGEEKLEFDDSYPSVDEAKQALLESNHSWGRYLIIPSVYVHVEFK
jgi:hypothetical protein